MSIVDIHKECFKYLINYRKDHPELLFLTRQKTNKNRSVPNGYIFIGSETYLHITFWDGGDKNEKVNNIGFVIHDNGTSKIEITGRTDPQKGKLLRELVDHLEKSTNTTYTEIKNNKWCLEYEGDDYLLNLEKFLNVEKNYIDAFLKSCKNCPIGFISETKFSKLINKVLITEKEINESESKFKKEGLLNVSRSEYRVELLHNRLQNKFFSYLKDSGKYTKVFMEKNFVDIVGRLENGKNDFYEVKPYSAKYAIRHAIGQLLEYNHYPSDNKADKLYIVSFMEPTQDDCTYIEYIRNEYSINIYYVFFDLHKQTSIEY